MTLRNRIIACVGLLGVTLGCSSYQRYPWPNEGVLLAEYESSDRAVSYLLQTGKAGEQQILRTETRTVRIATLGAVVTDIDSDLAKNLNVSPRSGVWVQVVGADSPGARGGLRYGDIIREIDGREVRSKARLTEILERELTPDAPVRLLGWRWVTENRRRRLDPLDLIVIPQVAQRTIQTGPESIPLETSPDGWEFTGMRLAAIPPDVAREIYPNANDTTVVAAVMTGSPAYLAGVRSGDRIVAIENSDEAGNRDLRAAVWAHADPKKLRAEGDPLALTVAGPLGPHSARIAFDRDLERKRRVWIPILFDYESTVGDTRWSFLRFILQFGASYRRRFVPSEDREPARMSRLSLLPFGMFEIDSSPTRNRYTFLWFLSLESDK